MNKNKKLVILDLDETLIRSIRKKVWRQTGFENYDFDVRCKLCDEIEDWKVIIRPHYFTNLLKWINKSNFDFGIHTAAHEDYASRIAFSLKLHDKIKFIKSRKDCIFNVWGITKCLDENNIGYELENILILDNDKNVWGKYYKTNQILVPSFFGENDDEVLKHLPDFVDTCFTNGINKYNKITWFETFQKYGNIAVNS